MYIRLLFLLLLYFICCTPLANVCCAHASNGTHNIRARFHGLNWRFHSCVRRRKVLELFCQSIWRCRNEILMRCSRAPSVWVCLHCLHSSTRVYINSCLNFIFVRHQSQTKKIFQYLNDSQSPDEMVHFVSLIVVFYHHETSSSNCK